MMTKLRTGKLNLIGGYSYTTSLPKLWIDSHLLSKGDVIYFFLDEKKNLVISTNKDLEVDTNGTERNKENSL